MKIQLFDNHPPHSDCFGGRSPGASSSTPGRVNSGRPGYRAFTLVELLFTIAIMSILMGLLSPALRQARDTARGAVCISNLKQLGSAFSMYLNDNNGWFMPIMTVYPTSFADQYVGKRDVFFCPGRHGDTKNISYPSYGYNHEYLGGYLQSYTSLNVSQVSRPERTVLLIDTVRDVATPELGWGNMNRPCPRHPGKNNDKHDDPGSRINVLWVDFHVSNEDGPLTYNRCIYYKGIFP